MEQCFPKRLLNVDVHVLCFFNGSYHNSGDVQSIKHIHIGHQHNFHIARARGVNIKEVPKNFSLFILHLDVSLTLMGQKASK